MCLLRRIGRRWPWRRLLHSASVSAFASAAARISRGIAANASEAVAAVFFYAVFPPVGAIAAAFADLVVAVVLLSAAAAAAAAAAVASDVVDF